MRGQEINLIRKQRLTMNDKKDNPTGEREGGTAVNLHPAVRWIQRPSPLTCRLEAVQGDRARLFVVGQRWLSDYFKTPVESPLWIVLSRSAAWSAAIPKRRRPPADVNETYSGNVQNIRTSFRYKLLESNSVFMLKRFLETFEARTLEQSGLKRGWEPIIQREWSRCGRKEGQTYHDDFELYFAWLAGPIRE